ncbi:hypothetical protein C0Q70_09950 [Pomacea canaliculata]|uniref:Uncharacterized protein n=1 Tax=Pomacea canaliculata TaxID=400727 RepID=A0A2T7PB86_POMCA|nr:uncharacterized protein LOC112564598 [Pomacea canaliculata]PVD30676.1 hypothetical protein C0Q70_09950 [Pomacea canaliculata]
MSKSFIHTMGNTVGKAAALDFGIQWACWAVASILQTEKFYDFAGSITFCLLTLQSLRWNQTFFRRQIIQSGMVLTWAVRLGFYLFTRILHEGQDRRFDKVRTRPGVFLLYWTIQGVWILLTLLPTLMLNSKKQNKPVTKRDYIGWSLWAIGFLFEALADYQKSQFRADPANAGKFICHGLWSISRHPNYFGEILMWSGLWLSASSVLSGWQQCVSLISPLFTSYLLIGISGIPLLEQYGQRKWGMDPAYQEYIKNTAKLVPYLW